VNVRTPRGVRRAILGFVLLAQRWLALADQVDWVERRCSQILQQADLMLGCDRDLANGVAVLIRNDNCRAP
jgi:hypothetical protein